MRYASDLKQSGRHAEELLEFSFRRLFDEMNGVEREVLLLLSLFQKPLPREAILVGCGHDPRTGDAIDELKDNALIQQFFDPDLNDFTFTVIPITRKFGQSELDEHLDLQAKLRKRMSDYYQASDVRDENERALIQEIRAGKQGNEQTLVDLALGAQRRGDSDSAERLYDDAVRRNPKSWRALKAAAEFYRDVRENPARALSLYAQCAANSPSRGRDRGFILREYGMLVRSSGSQDALETSTTLLEQALREMPEDGIALYMLATIYEDRGMFVRIKELLSPHVNHPSDITRSKIRPILAQALRKTNDLVKAAELERTIELESAAKPQPAQSPRLKL